MNYNQFENLSCYEEFEIQCALTGISKIDVLKERIGYKIDNYYYFISEDGIFNWFDLKGTHIKDPGVLKTLKEDHIPSSIAKCIIPNSVICIDNEAFSWCDFLKEITISGNVTSIGARAFYSCELLKEIIIPNSVTSIGNRAFSCCESLTSITIPDNVKNIGHFAFLFCESLKEVVFKGKILEEIKRMKYYPFGINDENIFKFS